eukprot:3391231-Pleurochrysis_carterae.AAC.1
MHIGRQRLREDFGHVLARVDLADLDASVRDVYSRTLGRAYRHALSAGRNACPSTARQRPSCPHTSGSLALPRAPSP